MKERKFLLDDAQAATKAALEEGIVPGGGVALLRCEKAVDALQLEGDEALGAKILRNVLEVPLKAIADNAGQDGPVVVNRVRQMKKNEGYDADRDVYGDMLEAGIVDPAKVVRTALQNAVSVASLLLTTSCLVTEIPKKDDGKAAAWPATAWAAAWAAWEAWAAWAAWAVVWEAWATLAGHARAFQPGEPEA